MVHNSNIGNTRVFRTQPRDGDLCLSLQQMAIAQSAKLGLVVKSLSDGMLTKLAADSKRGKAVRWLLQIRQRGDQQGRADNDHRENDLPASRGPAFRHAQQHCHAAPAQPPDQAADHDDNEQQNLHD